MSAQQDLKDKVIIITGASSGIGEATAHLLAAAGARLTLAARREDRLQQLAEAITQKGGQALVVRCDVTDRDQVLGLARQTLDRWGRIDVLINNAGLMPLSLMKNLHAQEWERMVDVNLKGVLYGIEAVLPAMKEQHDGHIINVSSVAGRRVFMGGAVYCATKFAVTALSEGLRMELTPTFNIRVTAIEPGAVATELTQHITDEEIKKVFSQRFVNLTPLQSPDIARAIHYALTQPDHVNVSEVLVMPSAQAM